MPHCAVTSPTVFEEIRIQICRQLQGKARKFSLYGLVFDMAIVIIKMIFVNAAVPFKSQYASAGHRLKIMVEYNINASTTILQFKYKLAVCSVRSDL